VLLVGFFALCVAPVVLLAGWGVARSLPGHAAEEARRLSRVLDLDVSFDRFVHVRPGVVRYEGLLVADPESGRPLLRCTALEAGWIEIADPQQHGTKTLALTADEPIIEAGGVEALAKTLGRLLRQTGDRPIDLRLRPATLAIKTDEGPQILESFGGGMQATPEGTQAWADFRLPGSDAEKPIRLRIVRSRRNDATGGPTTAFELDTAATDVPCRILALGLPVLETLGPECLFGGQLRGREAADGWDVDAAGRLIDVDLGHLSADRLPHVLDGTAQVTIEQARFHRGRLEEAKGTLTAEEGRLGRSFWEAVITHLRLVPDMGTASTVPGAFDAVEEVPLGVLGLKFDIGRDGIKLSGLYWQNGVILIDGYGRLLREPTSGRQPIASLIRALCAPGGASVPASPESDWLLHHLPLPAAANGTTSGIGG